MSHTRRSTKAKRKDSSATSKSRGRRAPAGETRQRGSTRATTSGLLETAGPAMRLTPGVDGDGAPVQAKVTVGAPDDHFEAEANAVAQRVAGGRPVPSISSLPPGGLRPAQRQSEEERAEPEEEIQRQVDEEDTEVTQRQVDEDETPPVDSDREEEIQRKADDGEEPEDIPVQPQAEGGAPVGAPEDEPEESVQPSPSDSRPHGGSSVHDRAARAVRRPGRGAPLSPGLRARVEPLFGRDFSGVRVHTGSEARNAARSIDARAFTHRNHIWLGERASAADASLMAHELTHVVQQGHAPALEGSGAASARAPGVQRASDERDAEMEAPPAAPAREETIQRFDIWGSIKSVGSSVVSGVRAVGGAVVEVAGDLMEMGRRALMAVVRRVAPDFARLIERDGLLGLLRDVVSDAFDALFGGVYDTITSAFDFEVLREGFGAVVERVQTVAGRLIEGDASAIVDAARSVSSLIGDTLSPVIDTVRSVAVTVQEVFSGVMDVVGTPVMDFLERIGGAVWRGFRGVVEDIGEIFSAVKDALGGAWERVKGWFGITADEGTDEGGGIWEWVKEKAAGVWNRITGFLEPIMGPLRTVGRVLLMLSPAGPALLLYEYWPQLQQAFAWIREQWDDLNIVVRARTFLREQLLPTLKEFLLQVGRGVQQAADWLAENVGAVASGVDAVLQALGGSALLRPLRSVVQFVRRQFSRAASFIQTTIRTAGGLVRTLFQRLVDWIDPLLGVLRDLIAAIANPFGIPGLLIGGAWRLLPDVLKGPIIDFILDLLRGFVRAIPPLPQIGLLWPFLRSGILGFLDRMAAFATARKVAVSNKIATIISGGSFSFAMGYLRGLATGIWEAVTGPFYAIAMLFDLPEMIRNFVTMLGDLFTGIAEEVRAIIRLVSERAEETLESVLSAARELLENPSMLIDIISGAIQAALDSVGELGASFAERLMEVFEQPDEQLGLTLGTLTGNILVEVLLAVFTAGAGNAIAGVGRVARLLRRVQRNFQRVLRLVADFMRPVLNFIDRIIDLFRGAISRVGSIFQRIGDGFRRIVDRFRNLFQRLRGRRPRGAPDVEAPGGPGRAARPDGDTTPDVEARPDVDTTPDVTPTPRPRPDVDRPGTRPRTDTPDPNRTPDRPPRDRDAETDAERRRRRRRDEDEEDDTGWIRFRTAVRRLEAQHAAQGASESELQRDVGQLRRRYRRSVSMRTPLAAMVRRKHGEGVWEVRAAPRGVSARGVRTVAEVLIEERLRFRLGRLAVRRRIDRLDGNEPLSTTYLNRILEPIDRDYRFSRLYAERDQAEGGWNIMGGMSPYDKLDDIDDTEGYHKGTHADPIPLHWYKSPDDYPSYLRINQHGARRTVPMVTTAPAVVYEQTETRGRERFELGVAPRYMVTLYTSLYKRGSARARDSEIANRWKWMLIRRGALDPSRTAQMHTDHVTDLFFDGPDDHRNLWLLRADVNLRPFHGWLNNRVRYKKSDTELEETTIRNVRGKVFKVVGFRYPPPDPGGRDGQ